MILMQVARETHWELVEKSELILRGYRGIFGKLTEWSRSQCPGGRTEEGGRDPNEEGNGRKLMSSPGCC